MSNLNLRPGMSSRAVFKLASAALTLLAVAFSGCSSAHVNRTDFKADPMRDYNAEKHVLEK